MSTGTLPHSLDVRKAAQRGLRIAAQLAPAELPRLLAALAGEEGTISASLVCSRDEQQHAVLDVEVSAELTVRCQRCLQTFLTEVHSRSRLAAVLTDEQARALPSDLEPLLAVEPVDLRDVVEDELVLAMPMFSYHVDAACIDGLGAPATSAQAAEAPAQEAAVKQQNNPFGVLAQLRRSPQDPAGD